jgi:hypothetical protein
MATWQFDLHLLPADAVKRICGEVPPTISQELFDSAEWWEGTVIQESAKQALSGLLSQTNSWSLDIQTWGEEDGNRVDLVFDNERLQDFFVRIDVRDSSHAFILGLLRMAKDLGLLMVTQDRIIIRPDFTGLMEAIRGSGCFRFVSNPEQFMRSIKEGHDNLS